MAQIPHSGLAPVEAHTFQSLLLPPQHLLIIVRNLLDHTCARAFYLGPILQPDYDEIGGIFVAYLSHCIAILQSGKLVLDVHSRDPGTLADLLHRQRLLIGRLTDRSGNLCMKIPIRMHPSVTARGVPIDSLINLFHFALSYPFSDFAPSHVEAPFHGGFRKPVFSGQLLY